MELKTKILEIIDRQKTRAQMNYELICIVRDTLKPFDGKKINARIKTAVAKVLPLHTIYFDKRHGMFHLMIWGNGIEYDQRMDILLGYEESDFGTYQEHIFRLKPIKDLHRGFEYLATCYFCEGPRVDALERLKSKIPEMIEKKKAYEEAKERLEKICNYHEIETNYDLKEILIGKGGA